MKIFNKRSATALMLAASIMSTCVAPAFAEGSRELTKIPDKTNEQALIENPANRPYLDWRDRDQFNMPSKNVVYVYANAGETIYFGSNVTNANEKSIEAIVHETSMLYDAKAKTEPTDYKIKPSLDMDSEKLSSMAGSSIAVTLPKAENNFTEAFDPEKKLGDLSADGAVQKYAEEIFEDGNVFSNPDITSYDRNKVYLFDVVPGGAGHISTREMENAGPNGVDGTTNGYDPLSFVAPYTGTYAFRFLSAEYTTMTSIMPDGEAVYNTHTIDFDGKDGLEVGSIEGTYKYYEDNIGYVTFYSDAGTMVKEENGSKYIEYDGGSLSNSGAIEFMILHDNAVLEIDWSQLTADSTDTRVIKAELYRKNAEGIYEKVSDQKFSSTSTTKQTTKITGVKSSFKAGDKVIFWVQNDTDRNSDGSRIYQVRYLYDIASAGLAPEVYVEPEVEPQPTTEVVDLSGITAENNKVTNDGLYEFEFLNGSSVEITTDTEKTIEGETFSSGCYIDFTNKGSVTDKDLRNEGIEDYERPYSLRATPSNAIKIVPQHDNAEIEVYYEITPNATNFYRFYVISDIVTGVIGEEDVTYGERRELKNETLSSNGPATGKIKITGLSANEVAYFYTGEGVADIYKITYTYTPESAPSTASFRLSEVEENPTPVGMNYTWSFWDLPGGASDASYKSNMILGKKYIPGSGIDYDGEYDYDIKVHGDDQNYIGIGQASLVLYKPAEFEEGASEPKGAYLEMIPAWDGVVEVVFQTTGDKVSVAISQPAIGVSEVGTAAGSMAMAGTKLEVKAGKPVYIYSTFGGSFLKSVKYTVTGTDVDLSTHMRGVNDPWANVDSLVSAWDVTVASDSKTYTLLNEFMGATNGDHISTDGQLTYNHSGSTIQESLKLEYPGDDYFNENGLPKRRYFRITPKEKGTITISTSKFDTTQRAVVVHPVGGEAKPYAEDTFNYEIDVEAGVEIYIYSKGGGITYNSITFTSSSTADTISQPGRAWADVLYLNAGAFQSSVYSKLNILTDKGFLYDVKLNGLQPYSFVFYSNNRGFLFDPWSMYSEPDRTAVAEEDRDENGNGPTARLQALEHSFYSYSSGSDVGDAPRREETDANGNPIHYKDKSMISSILGNYTPVDETRDATHKIFFDTPDADALCAYTGSATLRSVSKDDQTAAQNAATGKIYYYGLGNAADNAATADEQRAGAAIAYGTEGIGGRFMMKFDSATDAETLSDLGASISILLDFSKYALDENNKVIRVSNPDAVTQWMTREDAVDANLDSPAVDGDAESHNKVSLSSVINGIGEYYFSWDGKDAYGNTVPPGEYGEVFMQYVELGMAHFPFLDAEHNPNGFKVKMRNNITRSADDASADTIYYNNEAVSPNTVADPTNWYYTGRTEEGQYPRQIGDGLNMLGGVKTNYDSTEQGGMVFGQYAGPSLEEGSTDKGDYEYTEVDSGYGNYSGIDLWTKYEIKLTDHLTIGVKPITILKPYVSFVATKGEATDKPMPFKKSHVGYNGQVLAEYNGSDVVDKEDGNKVYSTGEGLENIYGNTISTGFVTSITSATGASSDYVTWEITIPVKGSMDVSGDDGENEVDVPSYIKITENALMTQADIDEQEYLAYEMYSGLFEDYAIADDEINIGDEYVPDWEVDASLDVNSDRDMVNTATGIENPINAISEETYIEEISMLSLNEAGDYTNDGNGKWDVKMNLEVEPILAGSGNEKVNNGNIHQIKTIGDKEDGAAIIKLAYKLPTTITGASNVTVGLIIDNLYAPGATAVASYKDNLDGHHDITSTLFNYDSFVDNGKTNDSVQSSTHYHYVTNPNNEYYNIGVDVSPYNTGSKTPTMVEFEGFKYGWIGRSSKATENIGILNSASNKAIVENIWNTDVFCFTGIDTSKLSKIELYAGTRKGEGKEIDSSITFYALTDAQMNELATCTDRTKANAYLGSNAQAQVLGTMTIKDTGDFNTYAMNALTVTPKEGTVLVALCNTEWFCGNFDYMKLTYSN